MNRIEDTLTKLSGLRLSTEAKSRIRAGISTYADFHTYNPAAHPVRSPFWSSRMQLFVARGAALTLIVIMTGATSQASNTSLPGDVLYPVKTRVSEPVRTALIPSAKGKASWQAELAERRLEEATSLAVMQKLDPETEQELAADFESHVAQSLSAADELEQEGDLGSSLSVRSKLEARVTAHEGILSSVVGRLGATTTQESVAPASSILKVVTQAQDTVEAKRIDAEVALAGTSTVTDVLIASVPVDVPASDVAAKAMISMPVSPAAEQIASVSAERASDIAAIIEENSSLVGSLPERLEVSPLPVPDSTATTTVPVATTTAPAVGTPAAPAEDTPVPAPTPIMQKMNFFRAR